jgi:hypothetical protein
MAKRIRTYLFQSILVVLVPCAAQAEFAPPGSAGAVAAAEAIYADLIDAHGVLGAIDAGSLREYRGKDRAGWQREVRAGTRRVTRALARLSGKFLTDDEERIVGIMRTKLESFSEQSEPAEQRCADAQRQNLARDALSAALESCFTEIANNLEFEGERIDRVAALGRLHTVEEPERRKALFMAFEPLWRAVNGQNERDSAYRRLIAMSAKAESSPIDAAARTIGMNAPQLEQWLVRILETWSEATAGESLEPWDYRYASGAADRALAGRIQLAEMLAIDHRYYRDLGADLDALGVVYDLAPRAGKSSVAYADFLVHGRWLERKWQPTIARVLATYRDGSLGSLNELVHENGHAVHISAIRNRPAFVDWNDDLFVEAFADVPAWSLYEPVWQKHYLGNAAPEPESLRALFGSVMLDVAWALFEARMLREPSGDPNVIWTEITHRYLHIVPHPDLSWWAVRGQLVGSPGYMVNYGLGAVLTADLRERVRTQIGGFDTGNPRWYSWLSEQLLQYGSERNTPELLQQFLGRSVSPDALIAQLRRVRGSSP